ncbi:hypothetical protein Pcinc_013981 [Petrolisthes cinctipes]|uniref:DNA repair protein SWI5 homolog n=1 Tax=Petrolisthes cinctipes TaxID=88211 RepID=A0AAE1FXG3_PETCI|nr:hypothetical protein Pcinc_013981 [Petrolisthes cinctipes]
MSLRRSVGGTPRSSRVHQPFKSPFRTQETSPQSQDVNTTPTQKRTIVQHSLKKEFERRLKSCDGENGNQIEKAVTPSKITCKESIPKYSTSEPSTSTYQSPQTNHIYKKIPSALFSTPFRSPGCTPHVQQTTSPEEQLAQLRMQEASLDEEIRDLQTSGYKAEELQSHIDNLHRYNEIKDAAQLVLGRLAEMEEVTVKEMHEKYGVSASD